ncbi:unnamed protein product [Leptosia nina]|uniref:Uncharacterized protein n=1 Tax=Leptosia nina TaxID=320188 RepID=A0AAV1JRJ4_9NEOP
MRGERCCGGFEVHVRGSGVKARGRGGSAAGRHFSVLEEPWYTSVSGGCSLANSQVSRRAETCSPRPATCLPFAC